jgi:hypothetical protein
MHATGTLSSLPNLLVNHHTYAFCFAPPAWHVPALARVAAASLRPLERFGAVERFLLVGLSSPDSSLSFRDTWFVRFRRRVGATEADGKVLGGSLLVSSDEEPSGLVVPASAWLARSCGPVVPSLQNAPVH